MQSLIGAAYGVKEDTIAGGPGWIAWYLFDVIAKVPDGTKMAEANQMLQSLLADRFKLAAKQDTHPVPRYVLTQAKGGSKLKPASGSGRGCRNVQQPGPPPGPGASPPSIPNVIQQCRNLTSSEIAENLRQFAGDYFDHDMIDGRISPGSSISISSSRAAACWRRKGRTAFPYSTTIRLWT